MGIGAEWKKRREETGKTLEEVSRELRISKKYLGGIEEGDYSQWPAKVFSTGFIRAYANFLSVDPEPVLTEYYALLGMRSVEESPIHPSPEWLERERRRGSRRTAYAIATAAVLGIGLLLAWYGRHTALKPPPPPEVGETARSASPADTAGTGDGGPQSGAEAETTGEEARALPPSGQKTVTAVGGMGAVSAPYQLFLEASELTWIMYGRDEMEPVDVMLYPGDRLSIQAQKKIFLKIGNAGGVVGTLNGSLLPPFGEKGQVKEITLGE
jgi:hypothetical protein